MRKLTTGILAALMVVCFSAVGFAAYHGFGEGRGRGPGHGGPRNYDRQPLTEQQKQECLQFMAEKQNLRKEFLNNEVRAGRMSQSEADAKITLMDAHLTRLKDSNFERPVLTEEQRAAREQYWDKMRALEVEHVKKSMASGTISQERGQQIIQRLENRDGFRGYHGEGGHYGYGSGRHHGGGPRYWN